MYPKPPLKSILECCCRIRGHRFMVNACYNSECNKELRYLREGRVVRIVHDDGDQARVEHFWLCGPCSRAYEFIFEPDGSIGLKHGRDARFAVRAA